MATLSTLESLPRGLLLWILDGIFPRTMIRFDQSDLQELAQLHSLYAVAETSPTLCACVQEYIMYRRRIDRAAFDGMRHENRWSLGHFYEQYGSFMEEMERGWEFAEAQVEKSVAKCQRIFIGQVWRDIWRRIAEDRSSDRPTHSERGFLMIGGSLPSKTKRRRKRQSTAQATSQSETQLDGQTHEETERQAAGCEPG